MREIARSEGLTNQVIKSFKICWKVLKIQKCSNISKFRVQSSCNIIENLKELLFRVCIRLFKRNSICLYRFHTFYGSSFQKKNSFAYIISAEYFDF